MQSQKQTNKATVLPKICTALASTLVISQAVFHQSALAADANASALVFKHPQKQTPKYKIRKGDTILKIAKRLKNPEIHYYQVAVAIFLKNPQAFKNSSLNQLRAGFELLLPDLQESRKISLSTANELIRAGRVDQSESFAKMVNANRQPIIIDASVGADLSIRKPKPLRPIPLNIQNYQIQRGDTLLKIAKRFKTPGIHSYQLAIALFLKNPAAFKDHSLNKLIVGSKLLIPDQQEAEKIALALAKSLLNTAQKARLKKLLSDKQQALALKNQPSFTETRAGIKQPRVIIVNTASSAAEDKTTPEAEGDTTLKTLVKSAIQQSTPAAADDTSANDEEPGRGTSEDKGAVENKPHRTNHSTNTITEEDSDASADTIAEEDSDASTDTILQEEVNYIVTPLEEELMAEVTAIKSSVESLVKSLPSTMQQKKDHERYLETLKNLVNQLGEKIKQHDQQQLVYETQIKDLLAAQEKLLKEEAFYQQTYNTLQPEVKRATFFMPSNINQRVRADPTNFFLSVATNNRWNKPLSPLLEKTEALYCATDQKAAQSILNQFFNISPKGMGWPDEWLSTNPQQSMLYAGTMDILLSTLYRNIYRFPELTELTERVTLQWDYCSLTGNGGSFYNLLLEKDELSTHKAAPGVPLKWSGFHQWGFMIPPPPEFTRYVPELLEIREPRYAFEIFLHQVYRQHCFPHPVTGKVYTETDEERVLTRVFHPPTPIESLQNYPYAWMPYCKIPKVEHQARPAWPKHLLQRASYNASNRRKKADEVVRKVSLLKKKQTEKQKPFRLEAKKLEQKISSVKTAEQKRKSTIKSQLTKIGELKSLAGKTEREAYKKIETAQRLASAERRRVEQEVFEKRRLQRIAEARRLAEIEAENGRRAKLEAEKKRIAALAAEKKRKAKAEKIRIAKLEAEKKRRAELAAEKKRQAEAEKVRLAKLEAEKKRLAVLKSENERATALRAMKKRLASAKKARFNHSEEPPEDFIPMADAGGETPVVHGKKTKDGNKKHNISATLIYTRPLSGAADSGKLNVSWSPIPNWFARSALKYSDDEFTYSWGIGYSNWRPGTTSVQLNNWGPIKPGEGLALKKAVFSIGHKIDSEFLKEKKISTTLGFSKPLSGDASITGTFQWSPIKNWYFRTTAAQKIEGGPTNWSYGFGHFDWRAETWRVEYSNYGKNRYPFDNFKNGAITINRAWEF